MKYLLATLILYIPFSSYANEVPVMSMTDLQEQTRKINFSKPEKTYIIQVMASWCASCSGNFGKILDNIPANRKNLSILAISVDDNLKTFQIYYEKNKHKWNTKNKDVTFLLDKEGSELKQLALKGIPTTFIIRNKKVIKSIAEVHDISIITDLLKTSH